MGINTLDSKAPNNTVESQDVNQYRTALSIDVVPRNSSGVPTDEAGSLGTPLLKWINFNFSGNLLKNGEVIQFISAGISYQISSGKSTTDGYPAFLEVIGSSTTGRIAASVTPLEYIVAGNAVTLSSDIVVTGLTLAPSTNNTALINDLSLVDQDFTKYLGESHGRFIVIDTVGTEISNRDGTIQAFLKGSEAFLARIDIANNALWSFRRGIGTTERETLANNDTITLLQLTAIFLDEDTVVDYKTTTYPSYGAADPVGASAGDFHFNTTTNVWKKFSGSVWEVTSAVFLGLMITDNTETVYVEPEDFDFGWQPDNEGTIRYVDSNTIRVVGRRVSISGQLKLMTDFGQDVVMGTDMESGVIEAPSTIYYVYMDKAESVFLSDKRPRLSDKKLGGYHPFRYWRYLGFIQNDASSNISIFDYKQLVKRWEDEVIYDSVGTKLIQTFTGNVPGGGWQFNFTKTSKEKILRVYIEMPGSSNAVDITVGTLTLRRYGASGIGNLQDYFDLTGQPDGTVSVDIQEVSVIAQNVQVWFFLNAF